MPLVSPTHMLLGAQSNGYAVGAFNVDNMEMVQAVVSAAETMHSPLIIQTALSSVKYGELFMYRSMVAAIAAKSEIPIALHLDHCDCIGTIEQALKEGYTSVMIDGSNENFETNIELTTRAVAMSRLTGTHVEAELGKVGGKEDTVGIGAVEYTEPLEAKEFVDRTGISSLAVSIGTSHGLYSITPSLDTERLRKIRNSVDVPLVLHGASGISCEQLRECISAGICKVNFSTDLKRAYSEGIKEIIYQYPDTYDPKAYGMVGRERVKQAVMDRIKRCGCDGRS